MSSEPNRAGGERIRVTEIVKLFGDDEAAALGLLQAGVGKAEILERSGAVLGLDRVSFSVNESEILVVMGLSGSGKSTMLRCLNRLVEPTAGSILVDGTEVTTLSPKALLEFRREKFGMVFQHFALFPNRTIAENVEYGLEVQGVARPKRRERAMAAIELVGLKGWDAKYPRELSGGMQQRAGLARALAVDADILLMDEAFSALDPLIRRDMQDELRTLQARLKKTVVFVSHDLDEAIHLGGRIVLMKDGAIVQSGYPEEILLDPKGEYVRRFVEHIDVSSVLTLGRLVGAAQPRLHEASTAAEAWPLVEHRPDPAFVVTCARDMPIGRIGRDRLGAAGTAGRRLDALMEGGIAKAKATDVLKSVLPLLADEPAGVAVVDEAGRFVGLLTRERALRALAGSRDGNAADASSDPSPASTRSSPWTGPSPTAGASPNSRWTSSPTAA
ncbi:quaternary amine ABC transporter ATP-binding protein [Aureimonas pseudogalii]|uniref:Quaternary amine transport ATP-binding protein n=1 Tax=Aureimonas pseudogalii TaxID=1744844 RepID=A0A7W6H4Q2_9HYPH|nr:glycine betaine/L-proline ABC transporter ATP-binding protein [Aureimonas pseudogalii]MBB3997684.1 glycine betaine/proline transport system ATP-binding protein [Aureimonas pseudogalii]